jgi:DNA-binding beta-propeller fold protein YncE
MYIPEGARIPADLNSTYNFKSSTTLCHHRTKSIVYVTVTNRCVVSIIDYSSGKFVEQMRIPSGSNPSGVSMSMDCKKLYVSLHHYHTYPLGANKIWGYRSSDYYYDTPEVFDVGQKYYQPNPSGMALTPDNAQLWVANRATNRLRVIRTSDWTLLYEVHDVGNKPYDVKMTHAGDKVIVANDNSNNKENPNYITVVSTSIIDPVTQSPQILDKIVVGEHPFGIDITDDDKFVLVACREGKTIQKVNIAEKRVVLAAHLDGSPKHIKIYNDLAFVSCLDTTMVYVINIPDMTIVHEIDAGDGPAQIEIVPKEETGLSYDKMYVVVQGEDSVKSYNISTYALIASVEVGSMPNPIKYNTGTNMLIVGNSGEGSLCYIDPMTDTVKEWSVTGDTPEFITCYSDGSRWFVTAHGPKDLAVYGEGTPYIGDAYLDNDGNTYQFGAAYWMPSRTEWIRSNDNQLTGYASVEFKPTAQLQDNKGYAMLNVSGLNVAYAQIEQDVYALENLSDGAAKRKYEIIDFPFHASTLVLEEEIAKYVGIDPSKTPEVVDAKTGFKYSEGTDYTIDYTNSVITRPDNSAIPDSYDQVIYLNGTTAVALVKDPALYNYVTVYDFRDPRKVFTEGVDYTVETVGASKVIRRKLNPDGTCAILNDIPIVMIMRQKLKVRYNYHTKGQNYDDVVLSADFFWRWPRPENQWVTMDLDELVPRFVIADNDNLESWTPTFDRIEDEQKGVTMSGATDRALIATPLSVGTITGDLRNPINSNDSDYIDMSAGAIYVLDLGAIYYLSKIYINRTPALGPISYSEDGITWVQVTDSNSLIVRDGNNVTITFPDTWTPINGDPVQYDTSRRIKYLKMAAPDGAACTLYNVKAFGDWKCSRNFTFSGFNLWDSEGAGEKFMSLSGVGSDDTTIRTNKSVFAPDRYKLFFPSEKPTDTRPVDAGPDWTWYSGSIQVTDVDGDIVYKEGIDFGWDYNRNEIWRKARTSATDTILIAEQIPFKLNGIVDEASVIVRSFDTVTTYVKDTDYTISDNSIVRTANSSIPNNTNIKVTYSRDSSIPEGTTIRVYYVYVQESMAGLPIAMGYRDPLTGKMYDAVTNPSIPQHSVCESDATGAWIEWEFENNYRCDLYAGWIADLGLGAVDVILDDEVVLSISQAAAQTERFSQFIPDIKPGRHKIRIQQVRGAINFDRFKLEDYQLYFTNTKLIASPIVNPTELFSWYTDKIAPGSSRKYLGQGSQTMSGAYDALRVDNQNKLPDNSVPIKYQVRIRTELRDKTGGTGGGGELGIVSGKFERGTVIVSNVNLEKGTIPTYWRMAPSSDKITGFSIEEWNITDPVNTGIHTKHIADGAITPNKIRPFTIQDIHIDTDAAIQESKLDLNFPTHEHGSNNAILAELNKVTGWGTSGSTYKIARADHNHDDVYVKKSGASGSTTITGDLILDGNVTIPSDHALKHIGEYEIVHRRPLYGIADDLQFQTSSTDWEDLVRALGLTQYAMPSPKTGATRYYRLYAIYSDDCTSDGATPRLRIMNETKTASIYEWSMPGTWSDERYWRRDAYSPFFSMSNPGHVYIQMRIQNDAGNFDNSVAQHDVGLRWLELIAYDVYES